MKTTLIKKLHFILAGLLIAILSHAQSNLHDFTVKSIDGTDFPLSSLKGKKVLVVNTASKCGLTPQYNDLEALYKQYKDKNFVIIGFPANNFLNQEPGTNEEIITFCQVNYGVSFPMMEKISVKGEDIHPLYQWLTMKEKNGILDAPVKWNFQKFLIDENGKLTGFLPPKTRPNVQEVIDWIEGKEFIQVK